jgi:pimeloyl-ACP methyl ester carboxylesterase
MLIPSSCMSTDLPGQRVAINGLFPASYKEGGWNHFPDGLNDYGAAVRWINDNRKRLGISKAILQGESGGGNLSIATASKANREGWIDAIDGVYVILYVSGASTWEENRLLKELPSLVENNGYILDHLQWPFTSRQHTT